MRALFRRANGIGRPYLLVATRLARLVLRQPLSVDVHRFLSTWSGLKTNESPRFHEG